MDEAQYLALDPEQRRALQRQWQAQGIYAGPIDGKSGNGVRTALSAAKQAQDSQAQNQIRQQELENQKLQFQAQQEIEKLKLQGQQKAGADAEKLRQEREAAADSNLGYIRAVRHWRGCRDGLWRTCQSWARQIREGQC
jgi:hypothetical protein